MKTILITGGAGFIGSSLADRLLANNNQVVVVDNFNDYYDPMIKEANVSANLSNHLYHLERLDILDVSAMDKLFGKYRFDCIVHLAARAGVRPSLEDPLLYQRVNCEGTNIILEMARKYSIDKLVMASSSSVYGNNRVLPFKETDCVDFAISPYAATKKANEVLAHVYHSLFGFNVILLRFFTVYGPRQRPDLAINKFTTLIESGKTIDVYGDGSSYRDYTYIDDICFGIERSIDYIFDKKNVYEIINLGSAHPITLLSMIKTIESCLGKKADIRFLDTQKGDVDATYADVSKATKMLGYHTSVSFKEGIQSFINWRKGIFAGSQNK